MNNTEYDRLTKRKTPPSPLFKDTLCAFTVGGGICALGQLIREGWQVAGFEAETAGTLTSVTLVFLAAVLTGLGLYDKIAKHAGAGTLVPITGFANAVASPAVEHKTEGQILGTAAEMFTIAGPVIVFGTLAAAMYGVVLWIVGLMAGGNAV